MLFEKILAAGDINKLAKLLIFEASVNAITFSLDAFLIVRLFNFDK